MVRSKHQITLAEAVELTTAARKAHALPVNAWAFDRDIVDQLLAQDHAAGIRIYVGKKASGEITPVLVAIDAEGNDLYSSVIAEEAKPCPPYCAPKSPLNS